MNPHPWIKVLHSYTYHDECSVVCYFPFILSASTQCFLHDGPFLRMRLSLIVCNMHEILELVDGHFGFTFFVVTNASQNFQCADAPAGLRMSLVLDETDDCADVRFLAL